MNIFDGIEKLINEHGSAKILGERLLLAKDQNSAQEKRISELEAQLNKSETEKATVRSQLQRSQAENQQLTQEIKNLHSLPQLKFIPPFYYADGDQTPYCPICWDSSHVQVHLLPPTNTSAGPSYKCLNCNKNIIHPRIKADNRRGIRA